MKKGLLPNERDLMLRKLAETKLQQLDPDFISNKTPEEVRQLVHELQVHQVELEMQQDQLYETTRALSDSENKYRHLYLYAPNGYFTLNAQGSIVEVNFAAASLLGHERRMLVGKLFRTFVQIECCTEFDTFFSNLQHKNEHTRCEISLLTFGGDLYTLILEGISVSEENAGNAQYLISSINITDRKKAELAVESQTYLLHTVFHASITGIAVLDCVRGMQGEVVDFVYRLANPVLEQIAGRNLVGLYYTELFPDTKISGVFDILKQVVDTGKPVDVEHIYKDSEAVYCYRIIALPLGDGIVCSVEDITIRKKIENENLQMRLQRQKELLHTILDAQEEERRRISESLHNGVGQILFATKLNLDQINLDAVPLSLEQLRQAKQNTEQLLTEAIKETRNVSHELMPLLLQEYGLAVAISDFCKRFAHTGIHLSCYGLEERLDKALETAIYRIAQELVNNIVKHSEATRARIEVYREKGHIIIEAQDNGKGIDLNKLGQGIGLRTIQDRVKLLEGTVDIDSTPGKITLVTVKFPLPK
jgi:PAS domain S-box-containing protein